VVEHIQHVVAPAVSEQEAVAIVPRQRQQEAVMSWITRVEIWDRIDENLGKDSGRTGRTRLNPRGTRKGEMS
jgi:hypothetical protein